MRGDELQPVSEQPQVAVLVEPRGGRLEAAVGERPGQSPILIAADLAARTLVPPLEIPVGALTALVGGPYLLWLLGKR